MKKEKIKSALLWWSDVIIVWVIGLPVVIGSFAMLGYGTKAIYDLNWFWFFALLLILLNAAVICLLGFVSVHLTFYLQKKAKEKLNKLF